MTRFSGALASRRLARRASRRRGYQANVPSLAKTGGETPPGQPARRQRSVALSRCPALSRRQCRPYGGQSILQASINVIGALDNVSQAVGQPADEVRSLQSEANRWTAVEDELRTMLNGVSSANLIRRLRIDVLAAQAYAIGTQLARDPANAILVPHVEEIKRLKRFSRRKKAAQVPDTAAAEQPAVEGSGTSGEPEG